MKVNLSWSLLICLLFISGCATPPLDQAHDYYKKRDYQKALLLYGQATSDELKKDQTEACYQDTRQKCAAIFASELKALLEKNDLFGALRLSVQATPLSDCSTQLKDALAQVIATQQNMRAGSSSKYQEGEKAYQQKDWRKAVVKYKEALAINTAHLPSRARAFQAGVKIQEGNKFLALAREEFEAKKLMSARATLKGLKEHDPNNPKLAALNSEIENLIAQCDQKNIEGEKMFRHKEIDSAVEKLKEIQNLYPYHQKSAVAMVRCYQSLGKMLSQNHLEATAIITLKKGEELCSRTDEKGKRISKLVQLEKLYLE